MKKKKKLALFKRCGKKWESLLGLAEWDIEYRLPYKREAKWISGYEARIIMNRSAMNATIVLGSEKREGLNLCALHELLHLALFPLLCLGAARYNIDEVDLEYEEHRLIQKLIKILSEWED